MQVHFQAFTFQLSILMVEWFFLEVAHYWPWWLSCQVFLSLKLCTSALASLLEVAHLSFGALQAWVVSCVFAVDASLIYFSLFLQNQSRVSSIISLKL